jgi:hypothetical protein
MIIDSFGVKWTVHSTVALTAGEPAGMNVLPQNIHIMKKTADDASRHINKIDEEEVNINDI